MSATCVEDITVAVPRLRCPTCMRDYRIDNVAHTHGAEIKCSRKPQYAVEVYIATTRDQAQSVECDSCAIYAKKAKVPRTARCPGCNYVGYFTPNETGLCVSCTAPKGKRKRTAVEQTPFELTVPASTVPDLEQLFVRMTFIGDATVQLTGYTTDGTGLLNLYEGPPDPACVSDTLNGLRDKYYVKMLPVNGGDGNGDMLFAQQYHKFAAADKYPLFLH